MDFYFLPWAQSAPFFLSLTYLCSSLFLKKKLQNLFSLLTCCDHPHAFYFSLCTINTFFSTLTFVYHPWRLCLSFLPGILYVLPSHFICTLTHFDFSFSTSCTFYFSVTLNVPSSLLCLLFTLVIIQFPLHILFSPSCILFPLNNSCTFFFRDPLFFSFALFVPFIYPNNPFLHSNF